MGDGEARRRWPARVAVATLALLLALVPVVVLRDDPTQVEQARALVNRDAGFATGLEAGETLAKVAQHLELAVQDCRDDRRGVSCQALAAALGYAEVLAPWVLRCTAPGRLEARARMADYLDTVVTVAVDARRVPGPPRLPSCAE